MATFNRLGLRAPLLCALVPSLKLLFASLVGATPSYYNGMSPLTKHTDAGFSETEAGTMIVYLSTAAALVLLGGAFAGLTIALMGQDEIYLQVIAESGEANERRSAERVLNLLKKGKHWVLVTLLLGNVITNETLPIMLDRSLGGGWQAVVGSTVLIVIFGEIVPQSICVRFGLPIGSFMAPLVLGLMWIFGPVAWPTAKLLDYLLGQDHGTTYKKAGLKTLVTLHRTLGSSADDRLNKDEVTIISAVLDLKEKPVGSIMTPMEDVFTLSADTRLNEDMMDSILSEGYSRIPIYAVDDPNNFIGMLLVKMLITYDPEDSMRVDDFQLATLPETRPETSCLDIVNFFQEGKSHMVLVSEFPGETHGALGVVTLEDVIEELIGEEIIDESDVFVDIHKAIRRLNPTPWFKVPKAARAADIADTTSNGPTSPDTAMERKQSSFSDVTPRYATVSPHGHTTKLVRRRSSGGANTLSLQRMDPELKNHLKHLGPSNAASRPRLTKINTVKIKPGQLFPASRTPTPSSKVAASESGRLETFRVGSVHSDSNLDNGGSRSDASDRFVILDDDNGQETVGLLSAGFPATDGAHSVGYGTLTQTQTGKTKNWPEQIRRSSTTGPSPLQQVLEISSEANAQEGRESQVESPQREGSKSRVSKKVLTSSAARVPGRRSSTSQSPSQTVTVDSPSFPAKLVISSEHQDTNVSDDEVIPDENSSGSQVASQHSTGTARRSQTRSGSIMERGIDVNGVQKIVLQVDDRDDSDDDAMRHVRGGSDDTEILVRPKVTRGTSSKSTDITDGSGQAGAEGKKKKKKRKKRGGKKDKSMTSPEASDGVALS